jgi:hypothetical protein
MYIFRFPANVPELTFEALSPLVTAACGSYPKCQSCHLMIGATVTVRWNRAGDALIIRLYETDLAWVYADHVAFNAHGDVHMSTREWLAAIVRDNGVGVNPWRVRRRKSDGPGLGGVLCLGGDRDKPLEGHSYLVDPERIERNRENRERWAAMLADYHASRVTS